MRIPLFDIDWTLLDKDPKRNIHAEAFSYAYEAIYGVKNPKKINVEGMLDNRIIVKTIVLSGIPEKIAEEKVAEAIEAMKRYFFAHVNEGEVNSMPGVKELLSDLKNKNVPLGLLTGNVEAIAWAKLEQAGIKGFFSFGAFGDSALKRTDLIEVARKKAEKALNRTVKKKELVIIGDTPLDISCAKEGDIESIGVASGLYPRLDLEKAGADLVISSLEEKDKVLEFLQVQ